MKKILFELLELLKGTSCITIPILGIIIANLICTIIL